MAANVYDEIVFVAVCQETNDEDRIEDFTILDAYRNIETALNEIQFEVYSRIDEVLSEGAEVKGVRYTDSYGDPFVLYGGPIRGLEVWFTSWNGEDHYESYRVKPVTCIK